MGGEDLARENERLKQKSIVSEDAEPSTRSFFLLVTSCPNSSSPGIYTCFKLGRCPSKLRFIYIFDALLCFFYNFWVHNLGNIYFVCEIGEHFLISSYVLISDSYRMNWETFILGHEDK